MWRTYSADRWQKPPHPLLTESAERGRLQPHVLGAQECRSAHACTRVSGAIKRVAFQVLRDLLWAVRSDTNAQGGHVVAPGLQVLASWLGARAIRSAERSEKVAGTATRRLVDLFEAGVI
eukprot:6415188-Prymnesium_polylepis.2